MTQMQTMTLCFFDACCRSSAPAVTQQPNSRPESTDLIKRQTFVSSQFLMTNSDQQRSKMNNQPIAIDKNSDKSKEQTFPFISFILFITIPIQNWATEKL